MSKAKRPFVLAAVLAFLMLGSFLSGGNRVTASAAFPENQLLYTYYSDPGMTTVVGHGYQPCGNWKIYMTDGYNSPYYTEEISIICCGDVPC
jgi:hypothetical protein